MSSDLFVRVGIGCRAAKKFSVDDAFVEVSDMSVGSVASSAVGSEPKAGNGFRMTVTCLETADKLLSDADRVCEEDSR
jgi:hypothetical protein